MDFSVILLDDDIAEGNESFSIVLGSSDPNVAIATVVIETLIMDNDSKNFDDFFFLRYS